MGRWMIWLFEKFKIESKIKPILHKDDWVDKGLKGLHYCVVLISMFWGWNCLIKFGIDSFFSQHKKWMISVENDRKSYCLLATLKVNKLN